ncbi:MAG: hydantoinase/oxoprolinase family protein, partial [Pseudomonadota bacterium]
PVIPRNMRLEVPERMLSDGTCERPVPIAAVEEAARALIGAGAEAACVFFVNGYANDANEKAAVDAVRTLWPTAHVTAATEIIPEIREFERVSTAVLNAYLQPVVSGYLDRLQGALQGAGAEAGVLIVQSNGGVMSVETAQRLPVKTALSGPAAGVIAAREIAAAAGIDNIITCDMGGTSFDVSLIADGEAALSPQTSIDFGMVIRSPMIEITTIGAGGGSIASVDAGGLLEVGPESAGSTPGPVCYGLGNDRPTVTDANLVLGRINPDRPIGGTLERLDVPAAEAAIAAHVGTKLGLGALDAAEAILKVANAKMAGAIRLVSIERGYDPARFTALPFGGGGALHAGALIAEIGLASALVPRFPGVTSALGCVVADMRQDRVQTINQMLADLDARATGAAMARQATEMEAEIRASGAAIAGTRTRFGFDMLYLGQTHTLTTTLPEGAKVATDTIKMSFEQTYQSAYGRLLEGIPLRVVNSRVTVAGKRPRFDMSLFSPPVDAPLNGGVIGARRVRVDGTDHETPVYDRLALPSGTRISGPALLEQPDTTIFVDPGLAGHIDEFGNLIIERSQSDVG